ncbi:MAG: chemotaxis-specific protein-glutamate methyltransferase CheB [Candidatus Thermoplasmatota archaeon]|nr:chemotaxis-specific protein-glutamate methyltransferase CheB [Candidatus Thermoplasmatota archaeon]MBS3790278.1 chemotaxis-specific protein-glutamate methyltransferase CheB [Candidatus Thermoplasmatota archaeon]
MSSNKIKAVVVDDSNFMVTIFKDILESHQNIEVVGTGKNGEEAIKLNREKDPDVMLIDVKMEGMDGLSAVEKIMAEDPTPVVLISGMGDEASELSVKALDAGAVDFIAKTSGTLSMDIRKKSDEIIEKIIKAAKTDLRSLEKKEKKVEVEGEYVSKISKEHLVVVASSAGGTRALDDFLSTLPSNFPFPIVVVQHMPIEFTSYLASTLDSKLELDVKEADDHDEIKNNQVYIIPSGFHGEISIWRNKNFISLKDEPKRHGVRPSADYLFHSASEVYKDRVIGVILTGMGKDGAFGAKRIRDNDGFLALQDQNSSVVYGMPKAAMEKAGCDFEGTPTEIGKKLVEMFMEENL